MIENINELTDETAPALPPAGMNVLVQCEGYRCLAYRTNDGKWMSAFSHEELDHVIRVLAF